MKGQFFMELPEFLYVADKTETKANILASGFFPDEYINLFKESNNILPGNLTSRRLLVVKSADYKQESKFVAVYADDKYNYPTFTLITPLS